MNDKDLEFNDEIVEIKELEVDELLDIEVSDNALFYANDVLTHNCRAIAATTDFLVFCGIDQDAMVYNNEIIYKIGKNRIGGRVGEISKFYWDDRSLRIYDEPELDQWIKDAELSQGSRNLVGD